MGNEKDYPQKIQKQIKKTSKGYILVHKQAVPLIQDYIVKKTKRHGKFLYATSKQDKPTDGKDLNKSVTGIKKTPPGTVKAYTTKPTITTKIFGVSLLKAGRLRSIKYCEKDGCVCIFFIPQNLGSRYGKFQSLEEEAKIIRTIYKLFLEGKTPYGISAYLEEHGILSPRGKEKWSKTTIMSILTNEKYKGEAILQKSFTVDYLTKKKKQNQGEVPMYHVKNSHEAIISPEIFEMVQAEIEKRKNLNGKHSGNGTFVPVL